MGPRVFTRLTKNIVSKKDKRTYKNLDIKILFKIINITEYGFIIDVKRSVLIDGFNFSRVLT